MYNYTPQATHHAKFDFDPTTWVVWANITYVTLFITLFINYKREMYALAHVKHIIMR